MVAHQAPFLLIKSIMEMLFNSVSPATTHACSALALRSTAWPALKVITSRMDSALSTKKIPMTPMASVAQTL